MAAGFSPRRLRQQACPVQQIARAGMELTDRISAGEGQTIEFKKSLSLRREALTALCSMANADSAQGMVIFGVEPNKTVCGVEPGNLDKAQRSLSQTIRDCFDPPLQVEICVENQGSKQLLSVSARRHKSVPYHEYDGRAWIRLGSENRLLTVAEKEALRATRNRALHPGPWKCDRCGSWVGQLFSFTMTDEGMKRNYGCECGGEFWPSAQ